MAKLLPSTSYWFSIGGTWKFYLMCGMVSFTSLWCLLHAPEGRKVPGELNYATNQGSNEMPLSHILTNVAFKLLDSPR